MAWHKRSNFLLLAGGASVYPLDSYVLVKIPFGHRLCLGMYTIFHSEREDTNVTENSRNYVSRAGDLKCMKGHVSM